MIQLKKIAAAFIATGFAATAFAQNVGIGETSPTAMRLQVKSGDSALFQLENSVVNGANTKTAMFFKGAGVYSGGIATIGNPLTSTFRMGLFTFGGSTPSSLRERMTIADNGNVGVGTTNPLAKLDVAGSFKLTDGTEGAGKFLISDPAGTASWMNINSSLLPAGTAGSTLRHNGTAWVANNTIYNNGTNVGIGNPNPAARLDVAGTVKIADGTQGDGKVLTSDANGNATWEKAPYGNTERFQFMLYRYDAQPGLCQANYNYGTAATTYTAPNQFFSIRIIKAGLYHFDANCYISLTGNYSATGDGKTVDFITYNTNTSDYINKTFCPYFYYSSDNTSRASGSISFDLYVPSNTSIRFSVSNFETAGFEKRITVTGHLIAE